MDRNPFIVDGPVPPDSPLYIERAVSGDVLRLIFESEIVHLVGPRGIGKTSLIQRTAASLIRDNFQSIVIDLSDFDREETERGWYYAFIQMVARLIGIERTRSEPQENSSYQIAEFADELTAQNDRARVLFLDEFDALERKGFTQPFFQFVRRMAESRSREPLALVFAGTNPKTGDIYKSIYSHDIELSDFTLDDCWPLRDELPSGAVSRQRIMTEIFNWTDGHPYLTQRACLEVVRRQSESLPVDRILQDYFVNRNSQDPNLEYLSRALTAPGETLLREYQKVLSGSTSINKTTVEYLTQIGLLKTAGPLPRIRNRIYREKFSEKWVELNLREKSAPEDLFNGRDLSAEGFIVNEHYKLIRLLGQGRAGNVYLAEEHGTAREDSPPNHVAVRVIPPNYLLSESHSKEETYSYFKQTLGSVAQLNHENITNVIDSGFPDQRYFYVVTQYVLGQNLQRFLSTEGKLRPEQTLEILAPVVEALAAAHDAGVLHGDLNPAKIFVLTGPAEPGVSVTVGDFGMAQLMNGAPGLPISQPPRPGQLGDPLFLAPEQLVGNQWDERADIYALGLVAYQLFGGELPEFQNLTNILSIKQERRFAPLKVSEEVQRAIMWALEPEPRNRPTTVREWFDQLSSLFPSRSGRVLVRGVPGSEVYIDETLVATIGPSGEIAYEIAKGTHHLRVVKDDESFEHNFYLGDDDVRIAAFLPSDPPDNDSDEPIEVPQPGDEFKLNIVNFVLTSLLAADRVEDTALRSVVEKVKEQVYGAVELFTPQHSLSGSVFVAAIRQRLGSRPFKELYERAKTESLKSFIYIKREPLTPLKTNDQNALPANEYEDLKKEMLDTGVAHFYDSQTEFEELSARDLTEWISTEFLPRALTLASESESADAIRTLLYNIRQPELLKDQQLLKDVRRRLSEHVGEYWFYLSVAEKDFFDPDIQEFFEDLNELVREVTGSTEFYVGAFQRVVHDSSLAAGWSPKALKAIQHSRVFVPLYNPNYFKDETCGKVWEFFRLRSEASKALLPLSNVLPVLWSTNESLTFPLPDAVIKVDYLNEAIMPRQFATRGVRTLKHTSRSRYESFVHDLAKQLVGLANSDQFPQIPQPPTYEELTNAFAPASPQIPTSETNVPGPTRWLFIADSAINEVTDQIRMAVTELGREIARRGYGLLLFGSTPVDYFLHQAFAEELANEDLLEISFRSVHQPSNPFAFSGGTSMFAGGEFSDVVELIKQSSVLIQIGQSGAPHDFSAIAEEHNKWIIPINQEADGIRLGAIAAKEAQWLLTILSQRIGNLRDPLVDEVVSRRVFRLTLDVIDSFFVTPPKARTMAEALSSIAFMLGDPLFPAADAVVNLIGSEPTKLNEASAVLLGRVGETVVNDLSTQGPLVAGETVTSSVEGSLNARYVIHSCAESGDGVQTIASFQEAVWGALTRAELLSLKTIAFPSVGSGVSGLVPESIAPQVLGVVLDHLSERSNLETVLFVFSSERDYQAYYDTFISLGGKPGYRVLLLEFFQLALEALRLAEALRIRLERRRISSSMLLWALHQTVGSATEELLLSCKTEEEIRHAFRIRLDAPDDMTFVDIVPVELNALPFLTFTSNCDQAFIKAKELSSDEISDRHLLAALLSTPDAHGTEWLEEMTGIDASDLYEVVVDPNRSIRDEIRSRLATDLSVETTAWTVNLTTDVHAQHLRVNERITLEVALDPAVLLPGADLPENLLRIPANSLELTGWIRAPGFTLQLELPFTIKLIDGQPETRSFSFDLMPRLSGSRSIEVEIYPGGRVSNLGPTLITRSLNVAAPVALPNIEELIDRRKVPNPQPDVMLYVALEEIPEGQQTRLYLTCPALDLDREILDPLPLTENDLAQLTANAIETAASANSMSGEDALAAVHAVGADLFDRLVNGRFEDYFHQIRELSSISTRAWSWLIISDEKAILPWELVNYYGSDEKSGLRYDDFFADRFQISHWVGQRGLRLVNSAPMGQLDLIHYAQHPDLLKGWEGALGQDFVTAESNAAQMSLLKEGSYCFGLHLLRFTERERANQIVALDEEVTQSGKTEGDAIASDQKLDLALRRPTVGVTVVGEEATNSIGKNWCNNRLESNWLIPFMQAGASALYGPRWPVSVEADQVFVQEFYQAMRQDEILGVAFSRARARVRSSFPDRMDWLAYSYFGHPHAEPYWVERAQGFTLFEAVNQPVGEMFLPGQSYRFRASYRTEAPAWYDGRLFVQEHDFDTQDMSVMVMPLIGVEPIYHKLERVAQSNELQTTFSLKMPDEGTTLPVMVRFQRQTQELRTLFLNLQLGEVE